jgi:hypothetical protein
LNAAGPTISGINANVANHSAWISNVEASGLTSSELGAAAAAAVQTISGNGPLLVQRADADVTVTLLKQANGASLLTAGDAKLRALWTSSDFLYTIETNDQLTLSVNAAGPLNTNVSGALSWISTVETASGLGSAALVGAAVGGAVQTVAGFGPVNAQRVGDTVNLGLFEQAGAGEGLLAQSNGYLRRLWTTSDVTLTKPNDELTIGLSATMSGLPARTTTLETNTASLTQSGANVTLNTTGNVFFQEGGTTWMQYAQPNSALALSQPIATQSRGQHDFYDSTQPLSLMARFDGDAGSITFYGGKTFTCNATATFASAATSAFSSSIKQGSATVSTSTGGVQHSFGGSSFKRFTYSISFPQAFSAPPQVYLTLASNSPSIKTHACSNITASGFDAHVDDYQDPTTGVVVQWLAIL